MFEESLLAKQRHARGGRRSTILAVALTLHFTILVGTVVANYWSVDAVAEPPLQVDYYELVPPPAPPPPPAAPPAAPEAAAEPTVVPVVPVQPEDVPAEIPDPTKAASPEEAFGVPEGVVGGDPNGVVGGEPSGVPHGLPTEPRGQIRIWTGEMTRPERISGLPPQYTEMARRARIQGPVILEAVIDRQGNITDLRVLRDLPMGLTEAAIEAVRSWKFRPATLAGQPVNVYYTLTVQFQLQ